MPAVESIPLILFSGLAADAGIFAPQKIAFPNLIVPEWPIPSPNETMSAYCARLAEEIKTQGRCVIGGASFGGVVALEVARYVPASAVMLIGSVRSPGDLPLYAKLARPLRSFLPWLPVRFLQFCATPATSRLVRSFAPRFSGLARQFRNSDHRVIKWSLRTLLEWRNSPGVNFPVFQIHGDRDFVLPCRWKKSPSPFDRIVTGGGHVISLTHPREVNAHLREALQYVVDGLDTNEEPRRNGIPEV